MRDPGNDVAIEVLGFDLEISRAIAGLRTLADGDAATTSGVGTGWLDLRDDGQVDIDGLSLGSRLIAQVGLTSCDCALIALLAALESSNEARELLRELQGIPDVVVTGATAAAYLGAVKFSPAEVVSTLSARSRVAVLGLVEHGGEEQWRGALFSAGAVLISLLVGSESQGLSAVVVPAEVSSSWRSWVSLEPLAKVVDRVLAAIERSLETDPVGPNSLALVGPAGSGRHMLAVHAAAMAGAKVFEVDAARLVSGLAADRVTAQLNEVLVRAAVAQGVVVVSESEYFADSLGLEVLRGVDQRLRVPAIWLGSDWRCVARVCRVNGSEMVRVPRLDDRGRAAIWQQILSACGRSHDGELSTAAAAVGAGLGVLERSVARAAKRNPTGVVACSAVLGEIRAELGPDIYMVAEPLCEAEPVDARRADQLAAGCRELASGLTIRSDATGTAVLVSGPDTDARLISRQLAVEIGRPIVVADALDLLTEWSDDSGRVLRQAFEALDSTGTMLLLVGVEGLFGPGRAGCGEPAGAICLRELSRHLSRRNLVILATGTDTRPPPEWAALIDFRFDGIVHHADGRYPATGDL